MCLKEVWSQPLGQLRNVGRLEGASGDDDLIGDQDSLDGFEDEASLVLVQ